MKVALVHDYLKEFGGAEAVLEALSDIFPDAPIYTSLYCPSHFGPHQSRLEKKWQGRVHQSFFSYIPFAKKLISPLRLLSPFAFASFDFSSYDLIISSATGAYFPNALRKKNAKLYCYCHTPPRYLYGLATARNLKKYPLINALAQFANHFLRYFDYLFSKNVDQYIANSSTTAARIKKFYRRDALVINPPVSVPKTLKKVAKKDFYLIGGRLAHAKRYDIPILACKKLNLPLKVFGRDFANVESYLKSLAGPKTEFLGEITNQEKEKLFAQAKGYIFSSDNEDFGIVLVESLAHGTPVLAYRSGGATETLLEGKTGLFFDDLTPESCVAALKIFEKSTFSPKDCYNQASKFSYQSFESKIKKIAS